MAIPVANPPPPYEPPKRLEGDDASAEPVPPVEGELPPREPSRMDPRARGCMTVIGMAAVLGCIVSIGLAVSCRSFLQIGEGEGMRHIAMSYRHAAEQFGEQERDDADLRALEQLGNSGELSLIAFGIVNNRFNDAIANDGTIDADELHHGMELIHDIVIGHGDVDMNRYPNGR